MRKSSHGFSLIELIAVLGIFSFLVALTLPNLAFFKEQLVRAQAQKIIMIMHSIQQRALTDNSQQIMFFDEHQNTYHYNQHTENLCPHVLFGFQPGAYGPPATPVAPLKKAITFDNKRITFYPNGTTSAGTLYLIDSSFKFMYAISIGVAQTPFMRIYTHKNGRWKLI